MAMMSLLGLYKYDNTILEGLVLPPNVNRDILVNNLLSETAEFEIIYTDPEFLQNIISIWARKELPVWTEIEKTLRYDYDPISNYDRHEEWEEDRKGSFSESNSENSVNTGESTGRVSGFNSTELLDNSGASTDVRMTASNSISRSDGDSNKRRGRAWGNIGVTTTQEMIKEQRDVVKLNIYDYIIESFIKRFCIMIY